MKKFTICITASHFGTKEDFLNHFAKPNRQVIHEETEFEGNDQDSRDPEHNTGILIDTIEVKNPKRPIQDIRNYVAENGFEGECYSVYDSEDTERKTVLYTEDGEE